jgi:hypothetical protein
MITELHLRSLLGLKSKGMSYKDDQIAYNNYVQNKPKNNAALFNMSPDISLKID